MNIQDMIELVRNLPSPDSVYGDGDGAIAYIEGYNAALDDAVTAMEAAALAPSGEQAKENAINAYRTHKAISPAAIDLSGATNG